MKLKIKENDIEYKLKWNKIKKDKINDIKSNETNKKLKQKKTNIHK